ncbi:ThiF family adenylyltransferase [Geomonas oryzisoli]|uniref:ThiF family adenylyltransferase n=1 Tax=Geomonas oryzisoli TaxID=2847992 RepID=A0ABX8J2Z1_9BACT|nr:ThiF family adenylyltransferase [Geomonas oryzisoli]QWV92346.1 ThiF family adenylyltransferase [Geomonas oryzisoli]
MDDRYARQRLFWGDEKQCLIASSTLLVAGVGGLGATVSQIMARAGVARMHVVDDGTVELSDLHRQSLYGECDLGRKKVLVACERLQAINSAVEVVGHDTRIEGGFRLPGDCTVVADCLDNFTGRFALYGALPAGCRFIHGGVQGDRGQVLTLVKGESQPLEEIYAGSRQPAGPIEVTPYGVFVVAGLMCNELCDVMAGTPRLLNRLLVADLTDLSLSFVEV